MSIVSMSKWIPEWLHTLFFGTPLTPFSHFRHYLTVPAQYYKKIMQIWYCIIFYNSFNAMATTFRSLSLQKKQPTHYLVKFTACGSFQVRSRGFFKCDGEVCTFTLLYSCTLILYPFHFFFGGYVFFLKKIICFFTLRKIMFRFTLICH